MPDPGANAVAVRRVPSGSFLALLGGAVAIGFAPIFVRLSEAGPVATAFWRLALALPVLWTLAALADDPTTANDATRASDWVPMIWAGLVFRRRPRRLALVDPFYVRRQLDAAGELRARVRGALRLAACSDTG